MVKGGIFMNIKRNKIVRSCFLVLTILLAIRILIFQVFFFTSFTKTASAQRVISTKINSARGEILDRNGIPFTNRNEKVSVVLKSMFLKGSDQDIKNISEILNLDFDSLKSEISSDTKPIILPVDIEKAKLLKQLNINGISIIYSLERYDDSSIAKHVTGYLDGKDNIGKTGIEKYFEEMLHYDNDNSIEVITDALKNPLKGFGYRLINNSQKDNKLNIKLTLDYHIQKIVEEVMNKYKVNGAVVVEEVFSGDIMALASKPDYDQNDVEMFLKSPQNELFNKAVAAYNIGSIFKIIDTAQAFETGVDPDEIYNCHGFIKVGEKEFKCTSYYKGGHGDVDLTSAFALSCNPYFINLGLQLGYENILKMAAKFGLGTITGLKNQGVDESGGFLPGINKFYSEGDIANISIGQGDVMVSPLQVADLVATVANGGIKNKVNIVDSVINISGNKVKDIRDKQGERIISKLTADKIKRLMEEVVMNGTGKKADIAEYGGSAGKTGSAETGQTINNEMVVQAWFAGYFPIRDPKYSISVFIENGKMGGTAAAPIFKEIAEEIMKKGY